ncbi:FAD-binding oxidoreductase [Roseomonas sp. KE2513]|uniref:NAD(P)/FAD-dependent oxidoreductase n=1 Tax=Roseomonas sp. KE2513 TaxID=2479202 RepID=UPI0018DF0586|nr:FAD-dependent oxidoreductase [Roseomonas sp. KE2513]MBI0538627.1 FAD-binding oxidoreductase [Roseomonas sp. KE2513]
MTREYDVAVLGGGLMGAAIGYGMVRLGRRTAILDEGDLAFRASRGNFSLVWVQSKGMGMPAYSAWTRRSAAVWPDFAAALKQESGVDCALDQPGGFTLLLSEAEMERRAAFLARLHAQPGFERYPYEMWDRARVRQVFPGIGPDVVGASYCPLDGHLNALRAFRASHLAFAARGGDYFPEHPVETMEALPGGSFRIVTPKGAFAAAKVVLAAGTGNARLGPMLSLAAPVRPQRGQALVTEKASPFLTHPVVTLRQTDEGGIMMGDSQEEAGFDTSLGLGVLAVMARRAARMFPEIGRLNVVRTWSALRVMTKDGFPIYQQSEAAPGAFLCNCHSGVTLAAAHALLLAPMIDAGALDEGLLGAFTTRRFDVSAAA